MTSIYRPILKIAWQILWRAKYLWIFGLFAVLVMNSGEFNLVVNNFSGLTERSQTLLQWQDFYQQGILGNMWHNFKDLFVNFSLNTLLLIALLVFLFLFVLWLAIVSEAGLVAGSYREYRNLPIHFREAFALGRQNFWPVLWLNVVGKIVVSGLLALLSLPLAWLYFKTQSGFWQFIFVLVSFVVLIPVAVLVSFLVKYAVMFVVLKKDNLKQAITNSWKFFKKYWVISIEMAIVMFLVGILAVLAMIILAVVLILPLALVLYIVYVLQISGLMMFAIIFSLALMAILLFWIGALLSTYQITAWVILFERLNESTAYAKIARLAAKWFSKKPETSMVEE
ncbi:MAG TPA: hypothetical protein PKZ16_00065 [bacterium]|nr:hypothetical protein [bacterium]HPL95598.1 hypothetical protein [bacterium]